MSELDEGTWPARDVASMLRTAYRSTQADEDASALEARYKTCAKHYIPADKCTPEIYRLLKAKANAPLDPTGAE